MPIGFFFFFFLLQGWRDSPSTVVSRLFVNTRLRPVPFNRRHTHLQHIKVSSGFEQKTGDGHSSIPYGYTSTLSRALAGPTDKSKK